MNQNKQSISYKKERVVISDILPYETPVIFSNRYFYRFLVDNKIKMDNGKITWTHSSRALDEIIKLLFNSQINSGTLKTYQRTIPFTFKIAHKESDYRALSIIHPVNQLGIVEFYNEFKETIKYFSSISLYSIRKPYKVAKYRFVNDYLNKKFKKKSSKHAKIELHHIEEEHLKSFFTYKQYSNIHGFFESYQYQRSEKKFNNLYKFDINKCFDSIYTHTIAWAIYNKNIVKDLVTNRDCNDTFGDIFDKLMQDMNYGETNGILIGSEVSRIFAELLLQQIDKNILEELKNKGLEHKRDYEIYRYVDDYFLFYDDEGTKQTVLDIFKHKLKEYNLFINEAKSVQYAKPIVTNLTIAKNKISDLINNELRYEKLEPKDNENSKEWNAYFKSEKLITSFKIIVKESNIEYREILNYAIALVEKKVNKIIQKFDKEENRELYAKMFTTYILETLNFTFFIYSVSPRVSATVKVVSLISKLLFFLKECQSLKSHEKELLFKKIYDEIYQILQKNRLSKYTQNETLYLLITLAELDKSYRLEESFLDKYFFEDGEILNYFAVTTLLYYIKNITRYRNIKAKIIQQVKAKFNNHNKDNLKKDTELVMLLLDLLSCPYVEITDKRDLLVIFGINTPNMQDDIISFNKYWFIKWQDFKLDEEMAMKKSQEVYS